MGHYASEMDPDWEINVPIRQRSPEEMIVDLQTRLAVLELRVAKLEGR